MEPIESSIPAVRDAYARHDWALVLALLAADRDRSALGADDLSVLGDAAWWLGRVDESIAGFAAAYDAYLREGHTRHAAMVACGAAVNAFLRGQVELGSGWIGRSQRLLVDEPEGVEHGYLAYLVAVEGVSEAQTSMR